ncbi:MAG: metal ABC transporter substrate-binding protein, partial [Halanaerobium sp.]
MKKTFIMIFILAILFFPSYNTLQAAEADVYVSIYPIYEIAERIGGERLNINQVTPDGTEVHGYEPSPRILGQLENSDLFIYVGEHLQGWTESTAENLKTQGVQVINLTDHVELIEYKGTYEEENHNHEHEDDEHSNHDEEDHEHGQYDNHIWLDFNNM